MDTIYNPANHEELRSLENKLVLINSFGNEEVEWGQTFFYKLADGEVYEFVNISNNMGRITGVWEKNEGKLKVRCVPKDNISFDSDGLSLTGNHREVLSVQSDVEYGRIKDIMIGYIRLDDQVLRDNDVFNAWRLDQ
ncbi:hypothetical protein CMI38_00330 [Candidatus Pacearchaeota archaeon]|jgi:hypothetical protein|nr:hypothetical protein [Candidatus Pacearchaeota archaeon]|tara:strand:+ start:113 stop:523 length:411 start_codon:yes stop_codon:yes gene_type:complete